ncbi:CHAT domain-containing protein [Coleofasciculus sp. FACHB-SPT9]|uniref:CHAT domain-containing protein n=1 Tax=Cyanophyceae TaxID=3028117 RepID=UPI001689E424|nr:CHAT domain-containing protein [Coleofasciculus sp. FACHB-SPT9]MBD1892866.1 tetratricopeptide repeat protein [Coleofasciculus sp. FACHB-SPT9]
MAKHWIWKFSYDSTDSLMFFEMFETSGVTGLWRLRKSKNYTEALAVLDKHLQTRPDDPKLWVSKGILLCELHRYRESINSYDRALKINPIYAIALNNKGCLLIKLEQYQKALSTYDKALKARPNYAIAFNNRGIVLSYKKNYKAAIFNYRKALEIVPQYHAAWHNLGNVYWLSGRYLLASHSYLQALKYSSGYQAIWSNLSDALRFLSYYPLVTSDYCKALISKPDYYRFWRQLIGNLNIELKQYKALFRKWLSLFSIGFYEKTNDSDQIAKAISNDYKTYRERGIQAFTQRQYIEAIASFEQAVKIQPNNWKIWHDLGIALLRLGRYAEAIASFEQALIINSDDINSQHERRIALDLLVRHLAEIATSVYQLLEFNPSDDLDWYRLGEKLFDLEQYLEAIASFDKVLKINLRYHKAWYKRGLALFQRGYYEDAIVSFDSAMEIKPNYYEALYYKGLALSGISRHKEAIDSFNQALEVAPNSHDALKAKGIALYELVRYQEAIESFEQAFSSQYKDYEVLYNLGNARKAIGRYSEAINDFNRALQLNQNQCWSAWNEKGWAIFNFKPFGYQEALDNWTEGLHEFHTVPEAVGALYHSISLAHDKYGDIQYRRNDKKWYWREAKICFQFALKFLTADTFCQQRLEVLKNLLPVCYKLAEVETDKQEKERQKEEIEALRMDGHDLLAKLINQTPSKGKQFQLWLKFLIFKQLRVDELAHSQKIEEQIQALELAEKHKNLCLRYSRYGYSNAKFDSPSYSDIKKILNPKTAAIYWHVSPAAITTFILKFNKPLVIWRSNQATNIWGRLFQQIKKIWSVYSSQSRLRGFDYPTNAEQLKLFEAWLDQWKVSYEEYRLSPIKTDKQEKERQKEEIRECFWFKEMEPHLKELEKILCIPAITKELKGVTYLVLIPHRDLHLLPIHALFPQDFIITYLPSIQVAIDLKQYTYESGQQLLIVENPSDDLPYAAMESTLISQICPKPSSCIIKGKEATKTNMLGALQTSNKLGIFHFSGHGEYIINQPLESALYLAGEDKLTLRYIFDHPSAFSNYRLVCLSACETGITGKKDLIDEFVGLVNGFLVSGTNNVVSSLWKVSDISTAFLMIKFYENLKDLPNLKPGDAAFALNQAQIWLQNLTSEDCEKFLDRLKPQIEQILAELSPGKRFVFEDAIKEARKEIRDRQPCPFANPFYWAAFTATGY